MLTEIKDGRTAEQVREHYELEKKLATKLKNASQEDRPRVYGEVYNELFAKLPHHPQNVQKDDPEMRSFAVDWQVDIIGKFLTEQSHYLEVGSGDCSLSIAVAKRVEHAYAIDVSHEIANQANLPKNLSLVISNGVSIDVVPDSIDLAFSNQLMEHLHPEDAEAQLTNILTSLKKGAMYVCSTPNKVTGPHDVSQFFDDEACGFHLKEYTASSLSKLFKEVGFRKVKCLIDIKQLNWLIPIAPMIILENIIGLLPRSIRHKYFIKRLLGIIVVGIK